MPKGTQLWAVSGDSSSGYLGPKWVFTVRCPLPLVSNSGLGVTIQMMEKSRKEGEGILYLSPGPWRLDPEFRREPRAGSLDRMQGKHESLTW